MSEELEACPFCGESKWIGGIADWGENSCYRYCAMCGAEGPPADNRIDATKLWNQRYKPRNNTTGV